MPELPEVQTVVSDLQSIVGDKFTDFFSDFPKAIKNFSASEFAEEIRNKKIKSVSRLGKIILIGLENKKNVAIHLKMTGKLILREHGTWNMEHGTHVMEHGAQNMEHKLINQSCKPGTVNCELKNLPKHLHHIFSLKNKVLEFHDVRKFATISLLDTSDIATIKKKYGIDPIDDTFSSGQFSSLLEKGKNRPIKEVLMNNSLILGIGNIYASEILFDAKILPSRKTDSLKKNEIEILHKSIKKILLKAIRLRGTSISDYRDANNKAGSFQNHLYVYKKNTQKCKKCATIISRSVIGQRSTFFCSNCQK